MGKKTYLPEFAKTMHYLGKYVFEHKPTLYEAIDAAEQLSSEEKTRAKRVADEILSNHEIFRKLWFDYTKGKL